MKKGSCGTCTTGNLHARQVISGNQWYLHDGELADALDRHCLFEGHGVETKELGSVVEAGLCNAAHLRREAISMQSSAYGAAVILLSHLMREAISMQSSAYGAAVILLSQLHGFEGQVADVQYGREHGLHRELLLSIDREHVHRLARGRPPFDVVDPGYLWGSGRGVVMSTCMHETEGCRVVMSTCMHEPRAAAS